MICNKENLLMRYSANYQFSNGKNDLKVS